MPLLITFRRHYRQMRFDELYLSDDILDAIDSMHFEQCTPIQEQTIPLITEGKDLIAVAQTGTGKTAAYLLPVIDEIANGNYPQDAINCIVMAPTRELAQQIDQQMQGFSYFMPVSSVAVYGGTDGSTFDQQKKGLQLGADVVIATPGRLIAHISMGYVDLSQVSFLILDEADRMLDMGFYDDIMQIVKLLPKQRQTLLFSATMPPKIKNLAKEILSDPAEVKLSVSKPAEKIAQSAYICYETQKLPILRHIFKQLQCDRSIVFASSKAKCKELCKALRGLKLSVGEMHSDLEQSQREQVLLDFKAGKLKILVATDIMARGIDIDDIGLVVNYDVPHENEDYVHRVGRTARADNDGIAITLVSEREIGKFKLIEKFIEKEITKNPIPEGLGEGPEYRAPSGRSRGGKSGNGRSNRDDRRKEGSGDVKSKNAKKSDGRRKKGKPQETEECKAGDKQAPEKSTEEKPQTPSDIEAATVDKANTDGAAEAANEQKPRRKRRRRSKKQSDAPGEDNSKEMPEQKDADDTLSPPVNDGPISYSMVSAGIVAAARAAREAEQKRAEQAAATGKTAAENEVKKPDTPAAEGEDEPKPKKKRTYRRRKPAQAKKAASDAQAEQLPEQHENAE